MSLATTIQRIDDLKKELDALKPIKPEYEQRIRQKFRLDWTYHSNSIEGNSLTYGETEKLILFGESAPKPSRDNREIEEHNKLLKELEGTSDLRKVFTEHTIRAFHKKILGDEPYPSPATTLDNQATSRIITPGRYKQEPNNVRTITGDVFYFTSPLDTPAEMDQLIKWTNNELQSKSLHPAVLAASLHYKFIRIHPFDDGNGRIARILMNIVLQIHGFPPVIVKVTDKEVYYSALRDADLGNLDSFINYIGESLIESLELSIRGARGEKIEEEEDIDKEIELTRLTLLKEREKEHKAKSSIIDERLLVLERSFFSSARKLDEKLSKLKKDFEVGRTLVQVIDQNNNVLASLEDHNKSDFNFDTFLEELNKLSSIPTVATYNTKFSGKTALLRDVKTFRVESILTFYNNEYHVRGTLGGAEIKTIKKEMGEYPTQEEISGYVKSLVNALIKDLK